MEITQIVAVGIVATILSMVVKKQSPEFSLAIGIMAGVIILIMVFPKLAAVMKLLRSVTEMLSVNHNYISIIFKVVGIAYIAEFGSQICVDAGESAIASKIDLAGKILIMSISAPVLLSLLEIVINILP